MQGCNKPCSYLKISHAEKKRRKKNMKKGRTKGSQREFNC